MLLPGAGNDETVAELLILGRHAGGQPASSNASGDTASESHPESG